MTQPLTLREYVDRAEEGVQEAEGETIALKVDALVSPGTLENLRKLRRLELLTDAAVLSLIGQAPIDPLGIFGALKPYGVWALQPIDFTAVQVLAKKGTKPVALMRVDLLSNDVTFVALKEGQLREVKTIAGDAIVEWLKEPDINTEKVMARFVEMIKATVDEGMKNA